MLCINSQWVAGHMTAPVMWAVGEFRVLHWCRPMPACISGNKLWHPDDHLIWCPKVDSGPPDHLLTSLRYEPCRYQLKGPFTPQIGTSKYPICGTRQERDTICFHHLNTSSRRLDTMSVSLLSVRVSLKKNNVIF